MARFPLAGVAIAWLLCGCGAQVTRSALEAPVRAERLAGHCRPGEGVDQRVVAGQLDLGRTPVGGAGGVHFAAEWCRKGSRVTRFMYAVLLRDNTHVRRPPRAVRHSGRAAGRIYRFTWHVTFTHCAAGPRCSLDYTAIVTPRWGRATYVVNT